MVCQHPLLTRAPRLPPPPSGCGSLQPSNPSSHEVVAWVKKILKVEKTGDTFAAKELWSTPENGVQFNTPVLKNGHLYGISQRGDLFCLEAKEGKTLWTTKLGGGGFGSVVDAGPVLLALTPQGDLVVFEPNEKEYKTVSTYKVGADTYACPAVTSRGLLVKDKDSVALFTLN